MVVNQWTIGIMNQEWYVYIQYYTIFVFIYLVYVVTPVEVEAQIQL